MQALRTAATGMAAQQLNVEVISNNIANMNTVGFKKQRAEFQDLLYQTIERAGAQSSDQGTVVPTGVQVGGGVKTGSVYRITQQGNMTQTGGKFDMAISGRGYFQVMMPSGEIAYTRAGNFSPNDQGQLVTEDGYLVEPAITIPADATDITISKSGRAGDPRRPDRPGRDRQPRTGDLRQRGRPRRHRRQPVERKRRLGALTVAVPGVDGTGTINQGYTEASNVDAVTEITALIVAQRAYEMNSKVITSADEMLRTASNIRS